MGVVINKSDIHEPTRKVVRKYINDNNFDMLGEIPYDKTLPLSLAEGKLAVTAYPTSPGSIAIMEVTDKVDTIISRMEES
jgi:MinD superfamily P-loop ATPase